MTVEPVDFEAPRGGIAANGDGGERAPFAAKPAVLEPNASPYSVYRGTHVPDVLRCLSADEFFQAESSSDLVIPALGIAAGPPTGIIGQAFVGKTIIVLSQGLSVATGKDLWGTWSVQSGAWLHLDYEQGRRHTKKRIHRLARAMGIVDEQLRILIDDRQIRIAIFPDLNLTTVQAADHFKRAFDGVRLVTCDSLRLMLGGVDENSSQVRGLIGALSAASEATRAAVVIIHHGGKTPHEGSARTRKEASRGSSGIVDEFQSMFVLTKGKDEPVALVTHEKDRELGGAVADFGLRIIDVAGGEDGHEPKWGLQVVHVAREEMMTSNTETGDEQFARAMERVTRCIGGKPGIAGVEAVAVRVKLRRATVSAVVKQVVADGTVVSTRAPKNGVRLWLTHVAPADNVSVKAPESDS